MKCQMLSRPDSCLPRSTLVAVPHGLTYPLQHGFCTPYIQIHRSAFGVPICATVMQLHTWHWIVSTPGGNKSVILTINWFVIFLHIRHSNRTVSIFGFPQILNRLQIHLCHPPIWLLRMAVAWFLSHCNGNPPSNEIVW